MCGKITRKKLTNVFSKMRRGSIEVSGFDQSIDRSQRRFRVCDEKCDIIISNVRFRLRDDRRENVPLTKRRGKILSIAWTNRLASYANGFLGDSSFECLCKRIRSDVFRSRTLGSRDAAGRNLIYIDALASRLSIRLANTVEHASRLHLYSRTSSGAVENQLKF